MPTDMSKYPDNWQEIRERILSRAGGQGDDPRQGARCEFCGVRNYAVGHRDEVGNFIPNGGSGPCDASGDGRDWPSGYLTYAAAREFTEHYNDHEIDGRRCDADGNKWIVIVLTIAHLNDPDPMNCADDNLAALCQKCHNAYDANMRAVNAARTRRQREISAGQMVLVEAS